MAKRAKVHIDDTRVGDALRRSLCGGLGDATDTLASGNVTCKKCLRKAGPLGEVVHVIVRAAPELAPIAPSPPWLDHVAWASSCKGAVDGRCRSEECPLCAWDVVAERWGATEVAAHNRKHACRRSDGAPMWTSVNHALVRLYEWLTQEKRGPSALGPILDRLRRGESGGERGAKGDDPLHRRADEVHPVREALDRAYPEGGHAILTAWQCKALLLVRTPGVAREVPTYDVLSARFDVGEDTLKKLVKHGRDSIEMELLERGLIARRRSSRRQGEASAIRAPVGGESAA